MPKLWFVYFLRSVFYCSSLNFITITLGFLCDLILMPEQISHQALLPAAFFNKTRICCLCYFAAEPISVRQPALRPHVHKQPEKTTRVRTVLNEKQLHTLRTCYAANPRPDALMKEQLVEMTGLSPRVIRVWFQNKRCKDKKRSVLMKQLQQQQPNDKTVSALTSWTFKEILGLKMPISIQTVKNKTYLEPDFFG